MPLSETLCRPAVAPHAGFFAPALFVLAVGIGGNAAVFSLINAVLPRRLPCCEPDRLHELAEAPVKGDASGIRVAGLRRTPRECRAWKSRLGRPSVARRQAASVEPVVALRTE
jgi:hypothetical protein